jgi:hypothetical protein
LVKPKPVYLVPPAPWDAPPVTRRSETRHARVVAVEVVVPLVAGTVAVVNDPSLPRGGAGHPGGPPASRVEELLACGSVDPPEVQLLNSSTMKPASA